MKPRLIVTHKKPHLDEVGGIWLLKRFGGQAKTKVHFITVGPQGGKEKVDRLARRHAAIALGVGLGRYDEHRGVKKSSCLLVWEDLKQRIRLKQLDRRTVEKIVRWINAEDTAQIRPAPFREFGLHNILEGYYELENERSLAIVEFGLIALDALFARLKHFVEAEAAWPKRIEFETKWGKAVALESDRKDLSTIAFRAGLVMIVTIDPRKGYRYIGAPASSKVSLESVYERLREVEPGARWYLHHSKKMLLSGADLAENKNLSQLSLSALIKVVASIK